MCDDNLNCVPLEDLFRHSRHHLRHLVRSLNMGDLEIMVFDDRNIGEGSSTKISCENGRYNYIIYLSKSNDINSYSFCVSSTNIFINSPICDVHLTKCSVPRPP